MWFGEQISWPRRHTGRVSRKHNSLLSSSCAQLDGLKWVWDLDIEWYLHLSSEFLAARCAKLLVLAGQERLDNELMVGQM